MTDQIMQTLYFGVMVTVILGYLLMRNRHQWKRLLGQGLTWVFLIGAVAVGYGLWTDTNIALPRQSVFADEGRIEVPRGRDGHYHLTLIINDVPVPFIVDTGASDIVLSAQDAARVGIDDTGLMFTGRAQTANGAVQTARVRLETVRLGEIEDRFVPAVVNAGEMRGSLLGMSYLGQFETLSISNNTLVLQR